MPPLPAHLALRPSPGPRPRAGVARPLPEFGRDVLLAAGAAAAEPRGDLPGLVRVGLEPRTLAQDARPELSRADLEQLGVLAEEGEDPVDPLADLGLLPPLVPRRGLRDL